MSRLEQEPNLHRTCFMLAGACLIKTDLTLTFLKLLLCVA